ncbi:hypothetical protein PTTG_04428 [Puccinia triticina 1-1 BBBD Race 1]|uniref:Phosphatidylinositol N-acetylglucosaminyltransferase n=1 Tax=Puccinia triticina (isolate 1-1 / race 1 (BBBD)) TaxID=630390 RepID=A0A180G7M4_PUCT1|nr:hypothetical protein PTTG_04428 [Puccinia triticina 1-1 BBBD Race 1]
MSPSKEWTLTIQHFSPTTRLYSLHSNRPVFRPVQDGLLIGSIAAFIPCLTWPSLPAFILSLFMIGWIYRKLARVYSESVLILGPLGIQFSSTNFIGVTRRFVAREHIRQAIIHEAIVGWDIVFFLGLVVEPDGAPMYVHQVFKVSFPSFPPPCSKEQLSTVFIFNFAIRSIEPSTSTGIFGHSLERDQGNRISGRHSCNRLYCVTLRTCKTTSTLLILKKIDVVFNFTQHIQFLYVVFDLFHIFHHLQSPNTAFKPSLRTIVEFFSWVVSEEVF